jgi:GNAT superfamily N-acetyltransferase
MTSISIRPMETHEASTCEGILRSLPEWFGIEEAIIRYRHDIESMDSYLASINVTLAGFITLNFHNEFSAEIQIMAVKKPYCRNGVGKEMVKFAEKKALERRIKFLQVKTLGPSHPDLNYKNTRYFYLEQGFLPLEENFLWGKANPCLIMVKHLG